MYDSFSAEAYEMMLCVFWPTLDNSRSEPVQPVGAEKRRAGGAPWPVPRHELSLLGWTMMAGRLYCVTAPLRVTPVDSRTQGVSVRRGERERELDVQNWTTTLSPAGRSTSHENVPDVRDV